MCALWKGFQMTSENEKLILKKNATILNFEEHLDHGIDNRYLLAARIYTNASDCGKCTRNRRKQKGKLLWIWKVSQGLQTPQQSNVRREAMQRSRNIKENLARQPITVRSSGYVTLVNRENKTKQAVKWDRFIKERKQKRQWRETTRKTARMSERRESQWMETKIGVLKT